MMPSDIDEHLSVFDRFAARVSTFAAKAPFFIACLVMVMVWAPSYFLLQDIDLWQLIINTATTIVTFLMVALLQNSSHRADLALQHKLNAIADALADLMCELQGEDLDANVQELKQAVGLENRESSS